MSVPLYAMTASQQPPSRRPTTTSELNTSSVNFSSSVPGTVSLWFSRCICTSEASCRSSSLHSRGRLASCGCLAPCGCLASSGCPPFCRRCERWRVAGTTWHPWGVRMPSVLC